jgi:hypothetical protein
MRSEGCHLLESMVASLPAIRLDRSLGAVVDARQRSGAIGNQQKYLKQRAKRPV